MTDLLWANCTVKLGELKPWAHNPRLSTKAQAKRIIKSFDKFGQVQTVSIGPGNEVYDGHQRLSALLTVEGADYVIDARRSSRALTEDERKELVVTLHVGAVGSWDWQAVSGWEADKLQAWGMDADALKAWNNDANNLKELLAAEVKESLDAEPEIDHAEELREKWKVELGQLWQLGDHRLICGDCTDAAVVERVMGGEKARLCHTDPPYGVDYANVVGGRANRQPSGWRDIENDALNNSELEEFLVKSLSLTDAPVLLCWHSWRRVEVFISAIKRCGWKPNAEIIWVKNALVFGMSDYQWRHETCIYAKRDGAGRQENRKETTVWEFDKTTGALHPTQKPVGLFEKALNNHTVLGDVVYEPFSGSGSQVLACESMKRRCRAVEISPAYVAVALERWHTATGKMPELIG